MDMTLFTRNCSIVCAAVGVLSIASMARDVTAAQMTPQPVSVSVEAGGSRSVAIYRVPTGMMLFVTQACQEHPAMYVEVGARGHRLSYNGNGCTRFEPGFVVGSGEVLNCVNKSGEARSCVLLGRLEQGPGRAEGARFYDVDAKK
jgi:hypothetical protein